MLGEACARYPDRYTGMAACAPQDADGGGQGDRRAGGQPSYGFKAVVINGHTQGEYLDNPRVPATDPRRRRRALKVPISTSIPSRHAAGHGEAFPGVRARRRRRLRLRGRHRPAPALRLIVSGVFDRLPDRKKIINKPHGRGTPCCFWQYRLDYMQGAGQRAKRYNFLPQLKKPVSGYLRDNFYITNSGVAWPPAIKFTQETVGVENTLYAMDYPYQVRRRRSRRA